jgi:hypothetical protein
MLTSTGFLGADIMVEFDQDKFKAVYKYLFIGFPEYSIDHAYDEDLGAPKFSVEKADEKYVVKFIKKYWDRCDANSLFMHLKRLGVANALRKNPLKNVIVNQSINLGFEPKQESLRQINLRLT